MWQSVELDPAWARDMHAVKKRERKHIKIFTTSTLGKTHRATFKDLKMFTAHVSFG